MTVVERWSARATRGGGRSWALRVLLATLAFALMPRRATGVWELEQLYEDELRAYVDQFTGNVDPRTGTPVDSKFLRFEQEGVVPDPVRPDERGNGQGDAAPPPPPGVVCLVPSGITP